MLRERFLAVLAGAALVLHVRGEHNTDILKRECELVGTPIDFSPAYRCNQQISPPSEMLHHFRDAECSLSLNEFLEQVGV
jgi:hypothetical protein